MERRSRRVWLYGILCVLVTLALASRVLHAYHVHQYQAYKEELEVRLSADPRFRDVRVFFYPTRPGVTVIAPIDMPDGTKETLRHLAKSISGPLDVPIFFKGQSNIRFLGPEIGGTESLPR